LCLCAIDGRDMRDKELPETGVIKIRRVALQTYV
jgi:hypothetical protein